MTKPRRGRIDTESQGSEYRGLIGWYERRLRRFKRPVLASTMLVFFLCVAILLGIAATPGVLLYGALSDWSAGFSDVPRAMVRATAVVLAFLTYGFTSLFVMPAANLPVRPFVKPFRGQYYSLGAMGWFIHNILVYAVRYTFLDWITPTPFNIFFYRAMGMKIGKGSEINTSNITDPALITLEDRVTIGGSATIIAHYAMDGFLVLAPVVIREGATIGLRAIIMGGVEVGAKAKILPGSVVLPKTVIPAGESWAGVPARKLERLDPRKGE
jgi:acetyltransferase-like isoleucine patch superfamily enzyme